MKLHHQSRVSKVVLILLRGHVVRREDVLLEHELLGVLLTLAQHTLVDTTIGPVVLAHSDAIAGGDAGDTGDLNGRN